MLTEHCRRLVAIVVLALLAVSARAQVLPGLPTPQQEPEQQAPEEGTVRIETLEELVQDIRDPERRDALVARLEALIAAAGEGETEEPEDDTLVGGVVGFFRRLSDEAGHTIARVVDMTATVPDRIRSLGRTLEDPERRRELLTQAGLAAGLALAAVLAHALARLLLRRPRNALGRPHGERRLDRVSRAWRLGVRLLLDLIPPAVAVAVTFALLSTLPLAPAMGTIAVSIVAAIVLSMTARRVVDTVLAPFAPEVRLVPVGDEPAQDLARALGRLAALAICGFFAITAARAAGAEPELLESLRALYGLVLLVFGVAFVLRFRGWPDSHMPEEVAPEPTTASDDLEEAAEPAEDARQRRHTWRVAVRGFARLWWVVALIYMLGLYALWVSGIEGAFSTALEATALTLLYVAIGVAAYSLGAAGLRKLGAKLASLARPMPVVRRRVPRYVTGARIALAVVVTIGTAGFVFESWGITALTTIQATILATMLSVGLSVLAVVFLAFAAIDLTTAITERYLASKERTSEDSAKIRTLVPLSQKAIKLVVWVIAGITVLGQIGISIGPILASIGVLGLAIGFGAQTLVKDIITGVFILLEDAVSVGDIVMIDGTGGLVEAINIRTIRLRDLSGVVHTIPYSTVGQFANLTKEFSCYLIECGVAYREDVDEVIAVLKEIGAEMQADPDYGPRILEPIEIFGLDRFEDSAVVVRARLKTSAGQQWSTGREFNRRMKRVFDERGIEIPFPHRTIYVGEDKEGKSPPLRVAGMDGEPIGATSSNGGDEQRE